MAKDIHFHECQSYFTLEVKYGGSKYKPGAEYDYLRKERCHGPEGFTPIGFRMGLDGREVIWLED
jgi:hypothetical protein